MAYVELLLPTGGAFGRPVYVREHADKSGVSTGRVLFCANLPQRETASASEAQAREAFAACGAVADVDFVGAARTAARVTFSSTDAVARALAMDVLPAAAASAAAATTPAQLAARFRAARPSAARLRARSDAVMAEFETAEATALTTHLEGRGVPDADGFVTVTYAKKRTARDEADGAGGTGRKRKKKKTELKNFYRHQVRDSKREQLEQLRQRFDDDKAKIDSLKAARRFRP